MRMFVSTVFVFCFLALSVNAQDAAEGMEPAAQESAGMDSGGDSEGLFSGTLIDYWVELPRSNSLETDNVQGRHGIHRNPGYFLTLRPYRTLDDGSKLALAMQLLNDGDYIVDDPYLMYSRNLLQAGSLNLSGYLRYYIPVSHDALANDRISYLRALVSAKFTTPADGVMVGLNAELRHYAYNGDGTRAEGEADTRDNHRLTLYGSISGSVGPFSFYTWHGLRFRSTKAADGHDQHYAYNETLLLTDIGDTGYKAGIGAVEYRPIMDSADLRGEGQNFLYNKNYTNYVLNFNGSF